MGRDFTEVAKENISLPSSDPSGIFGVFISGGGEGSPLFTGILSLLVASPHFGKSGMIKKRTEAILCLAF